MKKTMSHTKVSVKLRKSGLRAEWYLYLEAYPVFKAGLLLLCGTSHVRHILMPMVSNHISPSVTKTA